MISSEISENKMSYNFLEWLMHVLHAVISRILYYALMPILAITKYLPMASLSEIMSDRLKYNNPNIADLSDGNRPVKIAESFSELYDNEWTDAYDVVDGSAAKEKTLLHIIMTVYNRCKDLSEGQMKKMTESFYFREGKQLPPEFEMKVMDQRKKNAMELLPGVLQDTKLTLRKDDRWGGSLNAPELEKYINRCTELCWLMCIQTPPVTLEVEVGADKIFNKNNFREYTQSGKYVQFVVWPVMLLHEGGPILCKGVAQGCSTVLKEDSNDGGEGFSTVNQDQSDKC